MATQSLYRRYRPRRFSEVKGQEHVVAALRNAVMNHREGQAYLFSGPRGTGKTTSARILAKVLNCEQSVDGEPCCECESCKAVEAGTSYDVHELDAASNNGVEAMRDLIEKAMLGTPGRHKVYILDEVHMLSKGAEAALLKTLEEPPPHVVFVLATTDPQKVSETIRSRTQQLQFRLLPMDVLEDHVRWLAQDASLDVDDAAIAAALRRGGGSARDTLSALEVIASSGGSMSEETPLDEFVEALIESDPGRALAAAAAAIAQGRDARTLTEALVAHLRDCFLCLMAPELVQLTSARAEQVGEQAERLGAASTVRALETLGTILIEMRHAPDPRVLLDVALVKLSSPAADTGTAALVARIEKLEQALARGAVAAPSGGRAPATPAAAGAPAAAVPKDPATGRAVLGGRARSGDSTGSIRRPTPPPAEPAREPERRDDASEPPASREPESRRPAPQRPMNPAGSSRPASERPARAERPGAAASPDRSEPDAHASSPAPSNSPSPANGPTPTPTPAPAAAGELQANAAQLEAAHAAATNSVRPLAKAALGAGTFTQVRDGRIVFALPSDALRRRAEDQRAEIEQAVSAHFGRPVSIEVVADSGAAPADAAPRRAPVRAVDDAPPPPEEDDIDPDELVDAPKDAGLSSVERLAVAFPGSELVEDDL
ncbi:MAG: DNA polymerase III subunit gamma/tau [Ilumatobacteraceae bacterium]